jgi:carbon monoxide dehydrogenase subunit G
VAIKFGGEFRVSKKQGEVYDFLTDPNQFAPLLPDFESLTIHDATRATVKVKVGVAHIRGTASVQLELAETEEPRRAVYKGKGNVVGGSVTMTAGFDLAPDGDGTRVNWTGEAQLVGQLVAMAGGLIEPLAKKNVQRLIDALQKALM